jgi:hypothetical protein
MFHLKYKQPYMLRYKNKSELIAAEQAHQRPASLGQLINNKSNEV